MTEDEAKQKWCPFVRLWGPRGPSNRNSNVPSDAHPALKCIGSDCMAWRWNDSKWEAGVGSINNGYCGLAGKP